MGKVKVSSKAKKTPGGYVFTEKNPNWISEISLKQITDSAFSRIILFFVFLSPCERLSAMSKTLEMYGWENQWKKPVWLNRKLKNASTNPSLFFSASTLGDMKQSLEKANMLNNFSADVLEEKVCIYDNLGNQFMSLFCHLRNAFAHGRFKVEKENGNNIYIFEDVSVNAKLQEYKVSARMILKEATLIKWIEIIEAGIQEELS